MTILGIQKAMQVQVHLPKKETQWHILLGEIKITPVQMLQPKMKMETHSRGTSKFYNIQIYIFE